MGYVGILLVIYILVFFNVVRLFFNYCFVEVSYIEGFFLDLGI